MRAQLRLETVHSAANLMDRLVAARPSQQGDEDNSLLLVSTTAWPCAGAGPRVLLLLLLLTGTSVCAVVQAAAACLLVSSKYHETYIPSAAHIALEAGIHPVSRLLSKERELLQALDYHVGLPTMHTFLHRLLKAAGADDNVELAYMAEFGSEAVLLLGSDAFAQLPRRQQAAAVVYASCMVLSQPIPQAFLAFAGQPRYVVQQNSTHVLRAMGSSSAAARKYSSWRTCRVAKQPWPAWLRQLVL